MTSDSFRVQRWMLYFVKRHHESGAHTSVSGCIPLYYIECGEGVVSVMCVQWPLTSLVFESSALQWVTVWGNVLLSIPRVDGYLEHHRKSLKQKKTFPHVDPSDRLKQIGWCCTEKPALFTQPSLMQEGGFSVLAWTIQRSSHWLQQVHECLFYFLYPLHLLNLLSTCVRLRGAGSLTLQCASCLEICVQSIMSCM
jgi:hypothetical protein